MGRRPFVIAAGAVVVIFLIMVIVDRATSPDGDRVAVLGDSITSLGQQQITASLGSTFKLNVNGQFGAKVAERESEATTLAASNPNQVIINLGTNDVLSKVPTAQSIFELQQMVQAFDSASCVHLVTINTHLNQAGNRPHDGAVALNRAIAKLAADDGNVDVVDWDAINAAAIDSSHPNGLTTDGVHPGADGQRQLVDAYGDALQKCGRPWRFW